MDSNGKYDCPFSLWQQANLAYKKFTPILALALCSSAQSSKGTGLFGCTTETLPDLAEFASGPDAGLAGLLPLCPP